MKNIFTVLILLLVFSLNCSISAQTIYPKDNAMIQAGSFAAQNFSTATDTLLRVRSSGTLDNVRKSYVKYDLSTLTKAPTKAVFRIVFERAVNAATPAGSVLDHIDIYKVSDDSWTETTLNFNNAPAAGEKIAGQDFPRQASADPKVNYDFDITSYVTAEYSGNKLVSLCLQDLANTNNTDARMYSTRAKTKLNGVSLAPSLIITTTTGIEEIKSLPSEFSLMQNYPNPFNPSTTINFFLPKSGFVNAAVYNVLGQKIADLINGEKHGGMHQVAWNGKDLFGHDVNSGIYFATVSFNSQSKTIKMLLAK